NLFKPRWFMHVEPVYRRTNEGLVLILRVVERPVVHKVQYVGNEKIKDKDLAARTGLVVGSPFDVSGNREAARRLEAYYHEKGYMDATVTLQKGNNKDDREVIFRIHEGPKVRVVWRSFQGNKDFSSELLKTKLVTKSAFFWYFGGKFDPATIPDDIAALKQYYNQLGYFNVKIDHEVAYSEDRERVYLKYIIDEGVRSKIRDVRVTGNDVITEEAIRRDLKVAGGDFFNARFVNKDVTSIKDKYDELGRLYANVQAVPKFLDDPGTVDLVYVIDEDMVYRIRRIDVAIKGDNPHTKLSAVRNYIRIAPGDPASRKEIDRIKRQLDGSQIVKPGQTRVVITKVDPSESAEFVQPVRGQSQDDADSHEEAVRKETTSERPATARTLKPRTPATIPWSKEEDSALPIETREKKPDPTIFDYFEEGEQGDFDLQSAVDIRGQSVDDPFATPATPLYDNSPQGDPYGTPFRTPQGEVDLSVIPEEERTGRLMFGVGVNSDAGVVGSIVLSEQNFDIMRPPTSWSDVINGTAWRGGGQRFRAEAVPGTVVSRYMLSWSDPYFLDSMYSLGTSGFYYNRFFPDWDEERLGGRVNVGRQLTNELSVSAAIRLESVDISDPDTPTPQILQDAVGNSFLSTARFSVVHDTRDSSYLPSEGHKLELSYEQAFGEFTYPRAEADFRQFFTVYSRPDGGGKHILQMGGQIGWTGSDTPIFERFYAGGFQTFRGFAFRGVSPRELAVRIGGEWMAIGTVEYMIPLVASDMVQAVVFSDFGTVEEDVSFDDFRITAGFGLRVTVPAMGPVPLAFDFAFPIASQDFDDEQVFSFYVGMTR
ncbi:MAG: outer membrane protein assembly factor, partial [Planctomycetaceae bacterium]